MPTMHNAPLYASSNQMQRRDASLALAAHVPKMKWSKGERILDVGCGSGDVTASLLAPALPSDISLLKVRIIDLKACACK